MYKKPLQEIILKNLESLKEAIGEQKPLSEEKREEIIYACLDLLKILENGPYEVYPSKEVINILTAGGYIELQERLKYSITEKGRELLKSMGNLILPSNVKFNRELLDYVEKRATKLVGNKESHYIIARLTSDILYLSQIKSSVRGLKEVNKEVVEESINEIKEKVNEYTNLTPPLIDLVRTLHTPLEHYVSIVIPDKDRFGKKFTQDFYERMIEKTYSFLEELCGGARVYEKITGLWRDPSGRQFKEENKIVFAYVQDIDSIFNKLIDYLFGLKILMNQEAVMFEIDGKAYFL
ncbi:MAG: hypothetical protein QXQ77_00965 [Candidatus Aenigmatarchaeota archaeon]